MIGSSNLEPMTVRYNVITAWEVEDSKSMGRCAVAGRNVLS